MPRISVEPLPYGGYLLINEDDGTDIVVQYDFDYCGVASTFGWVACECGRTDGTVPCAHHPVSEMISDAAAFLDKAGGRTVDDPGYFQ
jgi:hypothetical protein